MSNSISAHGNSTRSRKLVTAPGEEEASFPLLSAGATTLSISISCSGFVDVKKFSAQMLVRDHLSNSSTTIDMDALVIERFVGYDDVPISDINCGPARQSMFVCPNQPDNSVEDLLSQLYEKRMVAIGILSGVTDLIVNIALYCIGRDRGMIQMLGIRERQTCRTELQLVPTSLQNAPPKAASKDKLRPSSRMLLQLAASNQFGGLESLHTDGIAEDHVVVNTTNPYTWDGQSKALPVIDHVSDDKANLCVDNIPPAEGSFDFCVSVSGFDGFSNYALSNQDTNSSTPVMSAHVSNQKNTGLFQSVMGAVSATALSIHELQIKKRTQKESPKSPVDTPVGQAAPAVAKNDTPTAHSTGAPLPSVVMTIEEDAFYRDKILQSFEQPGKSKKGKRSYATILSKYIDYFVLLKSCILERAINPYKAASDLAALLWAGLRTQMLTPNSSASALSAFRYISAYLQTLEDGPTRGDRGLGICIGAACALHILLTFELVRISESAQVSLDDRLRTEVAHAADIVSNTFARLAFVVRTGLLNGADVAWLLHVGSAQEAKGDSRDGQGNAIETVIGGAGNELAPSMTSDAINTSVAVINNDMTALQAFLANCGARFAGSPRCLRFLNAAVSDLGFDSAADISAPHSTPMKRRQVDAEFATDTVLSKGKDREERKRARHEDCVEATHAGAAFKSKESPASTGKVSKMLPDISDIVDVDRAEGELKSYQSGEDVDITVAEEQLQQTTSRGPGIKRTNSILSRAGATAKAVVSQRTNGARKREVTVAIEKIRVAPPVVKLGKPSSAGHIMGLGGTNDNRMPPPAPSARSRQIPVASTPLAMVPPTKSCDRIIMETPITSQAQDSRGIGSLLSSPGDVLTMELGDIGISWDLALSNRKFLRKEQNDKIASGVGSALRSRRVRGVGALGLLDQPTRTPVVHNLIRSKRGMVEETPNTHTLQMSGPQSCATGAGRNGYIDPNNLFRVGNGDISSESDIFNIHSSSLSSKALPMYSQNSKPKLLNAMRDENSYKN